MKLRTKDSFVDVTVDSATTEVQAQLSCKTRAVILSENGRHISYWIEVNKLPWAEETDKSHFQVVQEALVIFGSLRNLWVQYLSLISQKILLILKHKGPKGFLNILQYILRLYPKVLLLQPLHHLNWSQPSKKFNNKVCAIGCYSCRTNFMLKWEIHDLGWPIYT